MEFEPRVETGITLSLREDNEGYLKTEVNTVKLGSQAEKLGVHAAKCTGDKPLPDVAGRIPKCPGGYGKEDKCSLCGSTWTRGWKIAKINVESCITHGPSSGVYIKSSKPMYLERVNNMLNDAKKAPYKVCFRSDCTEDTLIITPPPSNKVQPEKPQPNKVKVQSAVKHPPVFIEESSPKPEGSVGFCRTLGDNISKGFGFVFYAFFG